MTNFSNELPKEKPDFTVVNNSTGSDHLHDEKFDGQTSQSNLPANTADNGSAGGAILNNDTPQTKYNIAVDAFKVMDASEQQLNGQLQTVQLTAMKAAYAVYYPFRNDETEWRKFLEEIGVPLKEQTKYIASPLLDSLFAFNNTPACKSKKSMWSSAIAYAAENNIDPDKFEESIRSVGGIAKAANCGRASKLTKIQRLEAAKQTHEAEMSFREKLPTYKLEPSNFVDSLPSGFNLVVVEKDEEGFTRILARLPDSNANAHKKFLKLIPQA